MLILREGRLRAVPVALLALLLLLAGGCRHKKYENPITKDTQQPDKVLFDKSIKDIEKGRYEVARLTLNTLINTYDTSEYLPKAKLAIADSWMREGGTAAYAQAEAEYKDFILFYPQMEEAAEAQMKICDIHYNQMEKPDRDPTQVQLAEQECRQVLTQFPNSRFAPQATQKLREIQEVSADSEFRVGAFYHQKGSYPAAANRLSTMTEQYPLYSGADQALFKQADAYSHMGPRFKDKTITAYQKLVREYPLSPLAKDAKDKLKGMEAEIPEPDPAAIARMKYEQENVTPKGKFSPITGVLSGKPDTTRAAKSGQPTMTPMRPTMPASIPIPAGAGGGVTDVTVSTGPGAGSALDTNPDARMKMNPPADGTKPPAEGQPPSEAKPEATVTDGTAKPADPATTPPPPAKKNDKKKTKKQ